MESRPLDHLGHFHPFGLPSLNGIILGAAIYTALMAVNKQRAAGSIAEEA